MVKGVRESKGIHRNWMSTAITTISFIRVQTVFQTGVWFSYKCSVQVFGSAISVPERQVSGSGGNQALRSILVLFLAFQFFARILKGWWCGGGGWQPKFRRLGAGREGLAQFGPIRTDRKWGDGVQKLDIFLGCHKCMVPQLVCNRKLFGCCYFCLCTKHCIKKCNFSW